MPVAPRTITCAACGDQFETDDPVGSERALLLTRINEETGETEQDYVCNKGCQQQVWETSKKKPSKTAREAAVKRSKEIQEARTGRPTG